MKTYLAQKRQINSNGRVSLSAIKQIEAKNPQEAILTEWGSKVFYLSENGAIKLFGNIAKRQTFAIVENQRS